MYYHAPLLKIRRVVVFIPWSGDLMIEFSENFNIRYTGKGAVAKRVTYRLTPRLDDIPYFEGGLDVQEFTYTNNLLPSIRKLLSDFQANVTMSGARVVVGDVIVAIPEAEMQG
jgi:hypothetical protein